MESFTKVVRLGTMEEHGHPYSIFCKIKFASGELSISGIEGPKANGRAVGSCGQISIQVQKITPAPGWTKESIYNFIALWDRWHLNKLRAGSPAQERFLRETTAHKPDGMSHYDWAGQLLADAGLNPEGGYKYGSAWYHEEIPQDVLLELAALPNTDMRPAWV